MERQAVDGVELVVVPAVGVVAIHDHHHFVVGLGPALFGFDDEPAVEALRDVRGKR
ncbi:hypothetical protein D3C86_2267590 [compost metagenome]